MAVRPTVLVGGLVQSTSGVETRCRVRARWREADRQLGNTKRGMSEGVRGEKERGLPDNECGEEGEVEG